MRVPFLDLRPSHDLLRPALAATFASVLDASHFILGERLACFEAEFAAYCGASGCIGVGNGLEALRLCLQALDVRPGDEILIPANTFIATALAVRQAGATPVLVEPCRDTYNLDPARAAQAVTARTRGIMPVHLYGQACAMTELTQLAAAHNLFIVEDFAQAHGATYHGQRVGSLGIANGTSFYPGKNLGCLGDGGAVTTTDKAVEQRLRMLRNYGSAHKYEHETDGTNSRLDELQAAFLSLKLAGLDAVNQERNGIAQRYLQELAGVGDVVLPACAPGATHVYHLFVIRTAQRDRLQRHLGAAEITTLIHYPKPIHLQGAFAELGLGAGAFPITEELCATSLSLPIYPGLTAAAQEWVISRIKEFYA